MYQIYQADVAAEPGYLLGVAGCAGLACLFLVSTIVLALAMLRRKRHGKPPVP